MTKLYLLKGFDKNNYHFFTPDPALFKTKEEAKKFCYLNRNSNLFFTYEVVRVGSMDCKKMHKSKKTLDN